jgi:oligopeptide/dipeptide ABC transporter ATP-binding protein
VAHDVLVMYLGRAVEQGTASDVLERPRHPYTRALIDAAPSLTRIASQSPLAPPSIADAPAPQGCAYAGRCQFARKECRDSSPVLAPRDAERSVACHFPLINQ